MDFSQKIIHLPWSEENIDLDVYLEKTLKIHFDMEFGAPFWKKWQENNGVNVIKEVNSIQDLISIFSEPFDENCLRELPIDQFMPKKIGNISCKKSDFLIGESGGSGGIPKKILNHWNSFKKSASFLSWSMDKHQFPTGENVTYIGPTGPHLFGALVREVAY
ncbi:MAG: hypothetical protein ACTSSI_12360, partial [Candidatus Helarchaeota archaeon]